MQEKKLKTLKDILKCDGLEGPLDGTYNDGYCTGYALACSVLRTEAIKWIKKLDIDEEIEEFPTSDPNEIIQFIMFFFNITEGDLK
jgi:hypothetical protein